ncbi:LysE family translocator [Balneicella halophila]|uniref:LysE family translocator n=1 Tax=Balneicella halophila TaxID=1537566 RepID=UPI0010576BA3|nr:LysE family transporter [Balneicella halophila]
MKIIKGFVIGLMVSIPLGPIGIIVIRRTLNRGWLSGFFSGLGAASADILYAIIAATGFGLILNLVNEHIHNLQIFTFCIIIGIGYVISRKSVRKLRQERSKSSNLFSDFISIFFLTLSNPLILGVFLAFFTGAASMEDASIQNIILILFGVFIGAIFWWFSLTLSVSLFRKKFRFRNLFWINKITGIVILVFGIVGLLYSIAEPWLVN